MSLISTFLGVSPGVQALTILGLFLLLLVVSLNRKMAINLVAFLRDLCDLVFSGDPGNRRSLRRRSRFQKRSRVKRTLPELGLNQGEQTHDKQPEHA